ncbi:hypothetical protein BDL97_17G010100 [Sphagnum fallax]|nr:hypothetical protein BDL97_17G010100 [Sphagnum fallax]
MGRFTLGTHTVCTVQQIFSTGFVVVASVCVCVCLPRLCGCWHCNSVWQELSPKDDRTCFANAAVGIVIPFGRNCLQKMIGRALQMLTLAILLPHPARMTRALDWSQSSDVLLCHADLQQCGASAAAAAAVAKNSRKILDVTHTLREDLPIWLGEDGLGRITAPEFYEEGLDVALLDLNILVGPVLLVDAPRDTNLTVQVLASLHIPPGVERIIFRTLNTDSYVGLTTDGAEWIVTQTKIRFIGIDYLPIAAYINLVSAHQVLLKKKLILVEGLNLDDVDMGLYITHCLPLKLMQAEGCPIPCILKT